MHQCLSCNQPCSLLSPFCDACRASLLARRDQVVAEEQLDMVKAGGSESGYPAWERGEGLADLTAFPQPQAPQVGAPPASAHANPPEPAEEQRAWSFEATNIYTTETANNLVGAGGAEVRAGDGPQATHVLAVPRNRWQRLPKNVRRALLIFCIVGSLALVTDSILLALSLAHHRAPLTTQIRPPDDNHQVVGPTIPGATLTPTSSQPVPALTLSVQRVTFSATVGQASLAPQTITLSGLTQGTAWRVEAVNSAPPWLHLSAWQGAGAASSGVPLVVTVRPADLPPGFYITGMQVRAFDAQGQPLTGSPASLVVNLTVHPLCALSIAPAKLSFGSVLGSIPAAQTLTLSASSACALPLSWQVSSDAPWLTFSRSAGTLTAASGSIEVQASTAGKLIGSYTAHITLRGTDSSGLGLVVTPAIVSVTLTVIA